MLSVMLNEESAFRANAAGARHEVPVPAVSPRNISVDWGFDSVFSFPILRQAASSMKSVESADFAADCHWSAIALRARSALADEYFRWIESVVKRRVGLFLRLQRPVSGLLWSSVKTRAADRIGYFLAG